MIRSTVSLVAVVFSLLFAPLSSHVAAHISPEYGATNSPLLPAIPIMVYHHIGEGKMNANGIWYVPVKSFEEQTQYLADNGFHTITLATYMDAYVNEDSTLLPQSIVLTFDDAYDDAYTTVFPLLHRLGMVGTFFIITGRVGQPGYLTWGQIKEMQQAGMEFGAHTVTHPFMTKLSFLTAFGEMLTSKLTLERQLGIPITAFAFPFNDHNVALMQMARLVGFSSAYIVDYHSGDPKNFIYGVPRITVGSGESLSVFKYAVNRAYRRDAK